MTEPVCRVCGSTRVRSVGRVEYLKGLPCEIIDCDGCGCRWSGHDATVHDRLHEVPAISYYADYRELLSECRRLFDRRDRSGLEQFLKTTPKYQFVLNELAKSDAGRVLEWGCSRGYLTAPSILAGRDILGVDISADAVGAARQAFGDHFAPADSPRIEQNAPYAAIYHVGLIGCVPDPMGLTRRLLSLLAPGGRLFFNAPNRAAMHRRGQLWLDSAPPPELITLFPEDFWSRQFGSTCTVRERITRASAQESTVKTLQRWFGAAWQPPVPHAIESGSAHYWRQPTPGPLWQTLEAAISKVSTTTGLGVGSWPQEYGFYVEMTA
jgi:SAM-dependent methyltransferase